MVFFFVLFAVGGQQKVFGQLAINITRPNSNMPNFMVTTNVTNITPYSPDQFIHQGIEIIAQMTFNFKNAAGATLYTTMLPISFKGNDVGIAWTNTSFINQYGLNPCPSLAIKSVQIATTLSYVGAPDYNFSMAITYPDGATTDNFSVPSNNTTSKVLTFATALTNTAPLSTNIQPSIYTCGYNGSGSGYLLYTLTNGGCPIVNTSNVYTAYTTSWHDNTLNQDVSFVNVSSFYWWANPNIGNNGTNINGVILAQPGHNYTVMVTDANGATATANYTVPTQIPNQFSYQISNNADCSQNLIITSPLVGYHTEVYFSPTNGGNSAASFNQVVTALAGSYSRTVANVPSGDHVLRIKGTIESAYNCVTEIPIHIGATISPTNTNGCVTALNANAGGTGYAWSNGQTTQSIAPTSIGTYTVTVTNATACSTATYTLTGGNTVACCQAGLTYTINTPTYTATSGTWANGSNPFGNTTAALNLNTNFIVPNGVTLTINNLNLNFSSTSKITIQKGGRLNLNGCVLDGLCSGMWLGIQVEGNGLSVTPPPPLPIGYINPGGLFTNNNTEIRNAVIGVTNTLLPSLTIDNIATHLLNYNETLPSFVGYSLSSLFLIDYLWTTDAMLKAGGVVNTQNTIFTNCFQGINLSWRGHKLNKIDRCTFNSPQTGSLLYPFNAPNTRTEAGIALMGSTVDEIGTSWALTAISNSTFNYTKFGIRANFINYLTIENCSFDSNKVGTSVAHFLEDASSLIKIRQNTYTQCVMAIQASGTDNLSIRDNHINENYNTPSPDRKIGIYARGSNPIARNNSIGGTQFGMILTDTEADGSLLAGNVLNNCFTNITAEGDNTGITTRCNHLINRWGYGIQIRPWSINNEPGDLGIQGNCFQNQPAAFTFTTAAGVGSPFDIRLDANTNPFTLEDVGANLLSSSSSGGSYMGISSGCENVNLANYCDQLGYTSINDIENLIGSGGVTDKALAEVFLNYLEADNYTAALQLLYDYQNRLLMQRRLVPTKIIENNTTEANNLLQQLPNETEEALRYKQFYGLLSNLKASNRNLINITAAEQTLLMDIANSRTKTSFKAQTCLYVARGMEFPVLLPTDAGDYTVFKNDATVVSNKVSSFVPNPSTQQSQLPYHLNDQETATLSIYDYTGRIIEQVRLTGTGTYQFNAGNYPAGMYVYAVTIDGNIVLQDKLVIIK